MRFCVQEVDYLRQIERKKQEENQELQRANDALAHETAQLASQNKMTADEMDRLRSAIKRLEAEKMDRARLSEEQHTERLETQSRLSAALKELEHLRQVEARYDNEHRAHRYKIQGTSYNSLCNKVPR